MKNEVPFYDPDLSYEDNYKEGPFGLFAEKNIPESGYSEISGKKNPNFLGLEVDIPFGIPAGPLLNSRYIKAAFRFGFDLCVYKTVRTQAQACHPLPNVLAIHPNGHLTADCDTVLADKNYSQPLSITNSFGVPSFSPDIWQPDMAEAVKAASNKQIMIGSFQGTQGKGKIEDDYALAARLVAETGAPVIETNLSCPNEGVNNLLCFDTEAVYRIVEKIKSTVPDRPLLLKTAYFKDDVHLKKLLDKVGHLVQGFSTINTLSARPVDKNNHPALSENRPEGGVCGDAIRWAGLEMVSRLAHFRQEMGADFVIVGVGGVNHPDHYKAYIKAGANAVMSATGAMWNPLLALDIKKSQV
ncbi:tRNA-dihydrouridine synthase [Zymomonas mobilis]|uniref:Dihydroorotate oxidase n=1 Tax=Zymomonas mobilis subsp. pomaceae (strain ATCC 29192 / DSM 22645 / JCM 10191 / CCUG 17912 / NBRC 13757 / NCIMB 11200 / NRRL B-4491 / Barker I) TaxID=579138 RepID=F8ETX7_ZYMMT|nr:tRNA-dihydrouridine synthase [Zymomonas mobilis]AEI38074.1 dihydroorotate oxidase [Zymomonas mobilis subsp. pomaceae ATCC 29192]MDX5949440.1 tRNA-dihydrouridine synthase [Zymomonas mobilis subsp. pomaceae]GEB89183.1 diguanylate cyclase [Zymomonas mobilis subsp. pomaceae]